MLPEGILLCLSAVHITMGALRNIEVWKSRADNGPNCQGKGRRKMRRKNRNREQKKEIM